MKNLFLKCSRTFFTLVAVFSLSNAFSQNDFNCGDFSTQGEAQTFFENQGGPEQDPYRLDSDGDGIACERDGESEGQPLELESQPCEPNNEIDNQTIVGITANDPQFCALFTAIDISGLSEMLQGPGPFTIFAPTDEAFRKLSEEELDALKADQETLARVLSYHVVPGSFTTSDITEGMTTFPTLEGSDLPITQTGVGDATVTAVNIPASNGVVFAIDTVLTPPEQAAGATDSTSTQDGTLYESTAETSERFELNEVQNSGVSGSVLVAEYSEGRTVVSVSLSGTPAGGQHPAALYMGSCDALGDEVAALEPVSGNTGFSTTVLDVPLTDIIGGDHALSVDVSEADAAPVACGEVGQ